MKMRPVTQKIIPAFVVSTFLVSILACGGNPGLLQTATPPSDTTTEPSIIIPAEALTPTFTPIPIFTVVSLVSNPTEESGTTPDYTIKAQTPFFQGSEDLRVTNFNLAMAQLTQEEIASFRDNVAQVQPQAGTSGSFYDQQYKL